MVDFNNETTVATPAVDIERVLILQKRENYSEAWENYERKAMRNQMSIVERAELVSRVRNLYNHVEPLLMRNQKGEEGERLESLRTSHDPDDTLELFRIINFTLDKVGLTRIDRESLGGDIIKRNRAAGLK